MIPACKGSVAEADVRMGSNQPGDSGDGTGGQEPNGKHYSLRWPDYHHALASTFRRLRDEEDFVDVTLACNNKNFTAHKVVLSACSPYFKQLLKVCTEMASYSTQIIDR